MRLVTYTFRGTTRLGALVGDDVVDLNRACALHRAEHGEQRAQPLADFLVPPEMLAFLRAGDPAMDVARAALAYVAEACRTRHAEAVAAGLLFGVGEPGFALAAPVARPGKVLAVGVNYKDHAEEAKIPLPERPIIFSKVSSCVIGPGIPIRRPRVSTKLDFGGELCIVIGRHARHLSAARAHEHVAGYMVGDDVSVRDWQFHAPTWMMGKSFDTHGPTGPWPVRASRRRGRTPGLAVQAVSQKRRMNCTAWRKLTRVGGTPAVSATRAIARLPDERDEPLERALPAPDPR